MKFADERKTKTKLNEKCLKCTSGNRHWAVDVANFTLIKRDRQQFICNMIEVYLNVKIILISLVDDDRLENYTIFFISSHLIIRERKEENFGSHHLNTLHFYILNNFLLHNWMSINTNKKKLKREIPILQQNELIIS